MIIYHVSLAGGPRNINKKRIIATLELKEYIKTATYLIIIQNLPY